MPATRRGPARLLVTAAVAGAAVLAALAGATGVAADSRALPVDRQDSQPDTPVNPYTADTDLHVGDNGGTEVQHSYVHLGFTTLPKGASITRLVLTMVQSGSQTGNVETQNATIEACPLTSELPATYDSSNPPKWDCAKASAVGSSDGNGTWTFDLQPLTYVWDQIGNTGAALVAVPEALPVGSELGPTGNSWAVAFDPTRSTAKANVTLPDTTPAPAAESAPSVAPPAASTDVSAPPPLSGAGVAPIVSSLPAAPVPPAVAAAPSASPSTAPAAPAAPAAAAVAPAPAAPAVTDVSLSRGWVVTAVLIGVLALVIVGAVAVRQVALTGSLTLAGVLGSLGRARSQVATPVSILAVAAVLAAGFAGRLPATVAGSTGAGNAPVADSGAAGGEPTAPLSSPGAPVPGAPAGGSVTGPNGAPLPGGAAPVGTGGGPAATTGGAGGGTPTRAGGALPTGVTPTTVRVAYFEDTNTHTIDQAAGLNGLNNTGDTTAQTHAMANWVNQHGGIAGHNIELVPVAADASNTDPSYGSQLCKQATEDDKVFAVIDINTENQDALACYIQHHTLMFNLGLNEVDAATLQSWSPYYWSPSLPNLDRSTAEKLDGLRSKNFFAGNDVVGYLYLDEPVTQQVISRVVNPRLQQLGYDPSNNKQVVSVGISATGSIADEQNAINNGMLKMKTSNVTKVFFVNDAGGALALYGMRDAKNLQYFPTGWGFDSQDGLDAIAYLAPSDEEAHAVGVGFLPWADTSTANSDGFPASTAEAQCYQIMNAAGIATPNPPGRDGEATAQMTGLCDAFTLFMDGSRGLGQNLTAPNFAATAERLGSSWQDSAGYANSGYIGPRHHDGIDNYRFVHWDATCTNGYDGGTGKGSSGCWKLDSHTSYRSPEV